MRGVTYRIGDKVYVDTTQYGKLNGWAGKVIKITPTGQITVANDRVKQRFNSDGSRIPHDRFHRADICSAERYRDILAETSKRGLAAKITRIAENASADVLADNKIAARDALLALSYAIDAIIKIEIEL
jgi:hypothetical protein